MSNDPEEAPVDLTDASLIIEEVELTADILEAVDNIVANHADNDLDESDQADQRAFALAEEFSVQLNADSPNNPGIQDIRNKIAELGLAISTWLKNGN